MKSKSILVILASVALGCLAACGMPTTGFDTPEQRWVANQSTQPIAYHASGAAAAAEPAAAPAKP